MAVAGIILPLLPSTPFLLLALVCFARSSRRIAIAIQRNKLFGRYLRQIKNKQPLATHALAITLSILWLSLGITALLFLPDHLWWVRIILLAIGLVISIHLLGIQRFRTWFGRKN